jgi:hypothetical protein
MSESVTARTAEQAKIVQIHPNALEKKSSMQGRAGEYSDLQNVLAQLFFKVERKAPTSYNWIKYLLLFL